jgi:hypothetical protein
MLNIDHVHVGAHGDALAPLDEYAIQPEPCMAALW